MRTRHQSTSGTPPRGKSSPRCPVPSLRSPSDRMAKSSSALRTVGDAWWPSTYLRDGCSGRLRTYPESRGGRFTSVPTGPRYLRTAIGQSALEVSGRRDNSTGRRFGPAARRADAGPGMHGCCSRRRKVATGRLENGEAYVDVYELPSGRRHASWRAGLQAPWTWSFSPDGRSLFGSFLEVVGNGSKATGFGQFWDPATGRPTSPLMAGAVSNGAIYTPAGDRLLSEIDFKRSVRDADTGSERGSRVPAGVVTASHPDGRTMLKVPMTRRACCGRCRRTRSRLPTEEPTRRQRRQGA